MFDEYSFVFDIDGTLCPIKKKDEIEIILNWIKNVKSEGMIGDIIFTHEGVSGPLIYKISSIKARDNFPYKIVLDLCDEFDLQDLLNNNPHKSIKNLLSEFVPRSLAEFILKNPDEK